MINKYIVVYAKLVDDKDMGALLTGVYFGGVCDTEEEGDELATRCASDAQGCVIIPKVVPMRETNLCNVVKELEAQFDTMADHIYENEAIQKRNR